MWGKDYRGGYWIFVASMLGFVMAFLGLFPR